MTNQSEMSCTQLVAELAKVGVLVDSIYDLVNSKFAYPQAINVLVGSLTKISDPSIKEGVVRALTVKEAKGIANSNLIQEFLCIPYDAPARELFLKWTIGNALSIIATDADYADLVKIVTNKNHAKAREMVVLALGNMKHEDAGSVLVKLLSDDEVMGHAIMALNKLKYQPALPILESLPAQSKKWIQKEIDKAIKKLKK